MLGVIILKCLTYIVARDFGFAPNPFGKYCTLATCKPHIRNSALVGDWIVGSGSAKNNQRGNLVYVMKVDEKITFNEYWNNHRFSYKKPIFNGSLKQMYGDNIYYFNNLSQEWIQVNSHHSNEDGTANKYNMERDLKSKFVLISNSFWFFGKEPLQLQEHFKETMCTKGRGHKCIKDRQLIETFISWLEDNFPKGYHCDPQLFNSFMRYDGIS